MKTKPELRAKPVSLSFIACFVCIVFGLMYFVSIQDASRRNIAALHDALETLKSEAIHEQFTEGGSWESLAPHARKSIRAIAEMPTFTAILETMRTPRLHAYEVTPASYTSVLFIEDLETVGSIIKHLDGQLFKSLESFFFLFAGFMIIGIFFLAYSEYNYYTRFLGENKDRLFTIRLVEALERERSAIAFDLHDTIAQKLGFISQRMDSALPDTNEGKELKSHLARAIADLRAIYQGLHSPGQGRVSFHEKLDYLFADFRAVCDISLETSTTGLDDLEIDEQKQLHLYRIVQELLTNCRKHSGARAAKVRVVHIPPVIRIVYTDDGAGMKPGTASGFGLKSIGWRLKILDATKKEGGGDRSGGYKVQIEVPLEYE